MQPLGDISKAMTMETFIWCHGVLLQAEGDAFFNPNDDGGKAQGAENLYGENRWLSAVALAPKSLGKVEQLRGFVVKWGICPNVRCLFIFMEQMMNHGMEWI